MFKVSTQVYETRMLKFLTVISEEQNRIALLSFAALCLYGIHGVNASPKRGPQLLLGQPL